MLCRSNYKRKKTVLTLAIQLACSGLVALPIVHVSAANTQADVQTAEQQAQFNIPAGTLTEVLNRAAEVSGVYLSGNSGLTEGKNSAGLNGQYSVEKAFQQLLAGTGITFSRSGKTVTLVGDNAGVMLMSPVRVSGSAIQENAYGPVDGYVAKRSATGTKTDTPLIEIPRSISVITADQIADQNAGDIGAVFRYTSGIYSELRGAVTTRDELVVRGFRSGNYVSRDGMFDADRETNAEPIPYGLERVELLKGPASVLYGQASPGGLVSTVTKRPTEEFFCRSGHRLRQF